MCATSGEVADPLSVANELESNCIYWQLFLWVTSLVERRGKRESFHMVTIGGSRRTKKQLVLITHVNNSVAGISCLTCSRQSLTHSRGLVKSSVTHTHGPLLNPNYVGITVSNVPDPAEGTVGFIAILYSQVSNL